MSSVKPKDWLSKEGQIWAYQIDRPGGRPLFVLGRYESACGGCDTFRTKEGRRGVDWVAEGLRRLLRRGDVIFEGVIVSSIAQFWVDLAHEIPAHFIFGLLDTPKELCIERVLKRRKEKGNTKPYDTWNLTEKYRNARSSCRYMQRADMDIRWLDYKHPLKVIFGWLDNPGGIHESK
jgi:hypothetical protein